MNGKEPTDLPDIPLSQYNTGPQTIKAACTGPDEGLTGVKRARLHLSAGPDIDFIDINQEQEQEEIHQSNSNTNLKYKTKFRSDQNANKQATKRIPSRKNSTTQEPILDADKTGSKKGATIIVSMISTKAINSEDIGASRSLLENVTNKNLIQSIKSTAEADSLNKNSAEDISKLTELNLVADEIKSIKTDISSPEPIAGVIDWKQSCEHVFGISISLYEKNLIFNEQAGTPIADCFGIVSRENSTAMALADGVNWGEGARLAARSAVQGSLEYLDTAVFGQNSGGMATTTREVFVSLLRSFWEAHDCILEVGGALSTLTVAVVLPLSGRNTGKYIVCACNVGDSLGYVYSKKHGVREFTQASHDITSMRDMRDALGALGPVDGNKPELSNLTLSLTTVEVGDIVFLTSDGVSDNFDPVVGKFAEAFTSESQIKIEPKKIEPQLAPKRQNKSASAIYSSSSKHNKELLKSGSSSKVIGTSSNLSNQNTVKNNLPIRPPRAKKTVSLALSTPPPANIVSSTAPSRPKYMRSHTVIEPRINLTKSPVIKFPKSAFGLPLVTGPQRHKLTLLRLEDLLCYGINGTLRPCSSAEKLCNLLIDFVKMITQAKRKILEQRELFYKMSTGVDGVKREVEMNRLQQRSARKRVVDGSTYQSLVSFYFFLVWKKFN